MRVGEMSFVALLGIGLCLTVARLSTAESPETPRPAVLQTGFNRTQQSDGRDDVLFKKRPAVVGDTLEQAVSLDMRMSTIERQNAEFNQRDRTTVENRQQRVVEAMAIEDGVMTEARVRYERATKRVSVVRAGEEDRAVVADGPDVQPVAGKTYRCRRGVNESSKIEIAYEDGTTPPAEEVEIVAGHMENVGRSNPLAEVLDGKTVAIGDTVTVPREAASRIFNLGDQVDFVEDFSLKLEKTERQNGVLCAVFQAQVDAGTANASQMRMQLAGTITVQVETCRAVNVDLVGPIAMSETRGSYSTSYQVIGTGQLKTRIASQFRDAKR